MRTWRLGIVVAVVVVAGWPLAGLRAGAQEPPAPTPTPDQPPKTETPPPPTPDEPKTSAPLLRDLATATPEEILQAKDLIRSKNRLVLAGEDEVQSKLKKARSALTAFQKSQTVWNAIQAAEANLKAAAEERAAAQRKLGEIQPEIDRLERSRGPFGALGTAEATALNRMKATAEQLRNYSTQLQRQIDTLNRQKPTPEQREQAQVDFERRQVTLTAAVNDLRDTIAPLAERYKALAADADVKRAIQDLAAAKKGAYRLKSDAFDAAVKEAAAMRKALGLRP